MDFVLRGPGMTQEEIHRDMQREWAELRKRMTVN